jgi:hypothetical protein
MRAVCAEEPLRASRCVEPIHRYSILPQQVGELGKVHSDPPCLIFGEEFRRSSSRLFLEVEVA